MPEGFLASKLPVFGGKLRQEMAKAQPQIWRGRIDIIEALGDLNSCPSCSYQGKIKCNSAQPGLECRKFHGKKGVKNIG